MKVLYAGSPEAAAKTLKLLLESQSTCGFEIAGVLTNPPATQGRHKDLIPTPVETLARENNLPVFTPEHLDGASREVIKPLGCDLLVSFAYGHIFGPKFLEMFPMGGINLHPSRLPKYRGCTPVPEAIKNREKDIDVTVQKLALKMDEGNILKKKMVILDEFETSGSLLLKSAEIGADLISELLSEASEKGTLPEGTPQEGEPSYTGIIRKADGKIDWSKPAEEIDAMIRAYTPDPGCFTNDGNDVIRILKAVPQGEPAEVVLDVSFKTSYDQLPAGTVLPGTGISIKCGKGVLSVTELQKPGKKAMNAKDFLNGARNFIGKTLG